MTVTRWPLCALIVSASFATAAPASAAPTPPPTPTVEWVHTSSDSVMDSESFDAVQQVQSAQEMSPSGLEQPVVLGDGFLPFSLRSYGDYTIKLVATGDGNIENYRAEAQAMANAVNANFGVSMAVAAGTIPAPSNVTQPVVPDGEIWLMITAASPCGTFQGNMLGCGGIRSSTVVDGEVRFSSGAVWLNPSMHGASPQCDQPVVSHEIGHALGLDHFDDTYLGQVQIMKSSTNCTTPTLPQAGDLNGIRWLSEPVPSNDTVATAAAVCPGDSSVSAHTWFATKESGEATHAGSTARRSVWYRFVPRAEQLGGSATISTANDGIDDFDTVLEVYTGSTPTISIASNNGAGNTSSVTIPSLAALTYWIVVDGAGGVGLGRGEMDVIFDLPNLDTSFVPLCAPARVLDTRPSGQTVDLQHQAVGQIAANTTYQLPIAGRAGVPSDAASVVLNVTAVAPASGGYVTVYPCGETQPNTSNLNFAAGDVIPNSVFAKIGAGGKVCLFASTTTHLLVDVSGFFPDTNVFTPLAVPGRLLDTRSGGQTYDGAHAGVGRLTANVPYTLPVAGRAGVPAGAGLAPEAVLNITAVQPSAGGYLTAYACGQPIPNASNLNFVTGDIIPNLVVTQLGSGDVCLFSSIDTDLLVDVIGYMKPVPAIESLPASHRMLDTRPTGTTFDGQHQATGRIAAGATYELPIAGRDAVPSGVISVVLNVTAVSPSSSGYVSVFPCGQNQPNASNLNFSAGEVIPNLVIAGIGTGGRVCFFTSADTDLLVDVGAYFP